MARRLSRFLHIERPRARGAEPGGEAGAPEPAGRFDAVERPKAGPAPRPATGARLERFEPAAPPERALELQEAGPGARPFTRCLTCGMDHGRHATACVNCGASLDTPEQQAFNARLWAERQAEAAKEAEAAEAFRAAQAAAREEDARARRAFAETLAREAGDAERRRLGIGGDRRPVGALLLALLPEVWRRRAAIGGGAALALLALGGLVARSGGAVAGAALLALLLLAPRGAARRW